MDNINNRPPEFSEDELKMPTEVMEARVAVRDSRFGIVLAALIIALVLILGGLYLWYLFAFEPMPDLPPERVVPDMPNEPEMQNADAEVRKLNTVSNSTEIDAIEADLESSDFDQLDTELQAIDAELEAN